MQLRSIRWLVACLALGGIPAWAWAADEPPANAGAPVADADPVLNAEQIDAAQRVLIGTVRCDRGQFVTVARIDGKEGFFEVVHNGETHRMVPEATTTGAVRLEDKKTGMMWLQIADKSMLMDTRAQLRMVDGCRHPSQRV